jgi:hypothetical protein
VSDIALPFCELLADVVADGDCSDGDEGDVDDAPCAATSADAMNRLATDPMSIFFIACSPWTVPGTRRP